MDGTAMSMHHFSLAGKVYGYDDTQLGLVTPDMVPCDAPVQPPPPPPTKADRINALLNSVKQGLTREAVQAIIAVAQLDAKVVFLTSAVPEADTLAASMVSNKSYRLAVQLENACKAIEQGP
jgi:hypothetical protein